MSTIAHEHDALTAAPARPPGNWLSLAKGVLIVAVYVSVALQAVFPLDGLLAPTALLLPVLGLLIAVDGARMARVFLSLGLLSALAALAFLENPVDILLDGAGRALTFLAFFAAILTVREPAVRSRTLAETGEAVVRQPPGRRLLALLLGSHVLTLMMSHGAIVLIGAIARSALGPAPKEIDRKRAALAVLRGFAVATMYSPLSLAPLVIASLVPGVEYGSLIVIGMITAALSLALSFVLLRWEYGRADASAAPDRLQRPPRPGWIPLSRIALLMGVVFGSIMAVSHGLQIRVSYAVILAVPAVTILWLLAQESGRARATLRGPLRNLVADTLPRQASEIAVLVVAGFMGPVLQAAVPSEAITDAVLATGTPPGVIAAACFLLIVIGGVLAVNPLITITILIGVMADPLHVGLDPMLFASALVCAWAFAVQVSPFTACSMIAAGMFDAEASTLTLRWNRLFGIVVSILGPAVLVLIGYLL